MQITVSRSPDESLLKYIKYYFECLLVRITLIFGIQIPTSNINIMCCSFLHNSTVPACMRHFTNIMPSQEHV